MKKSFTQALLGMVLFLLSFQVMGQGLTTSSISGHITDKNGEVLPGATIVVVHLPTATQYTTVSNNSGIYQILNMKPGGPYTMKVSFIGFATRGAANIELPLGQNFRYDVVLEESAGNLDEVTIEVDKNAIINSDRTGASTNLTTEQVNTLPTISRSLDDFTRLTPQSNGTSFAGRDNRFNNYTVDGNIYNNNFGLGSSQFAGGNPISIDVIEQVQVNLAPFDVRQNGFTGANVNAITRSGSNKLEGSAYTFYRNQNLTGSNVNGTQLNVGEAQNRIVGARLGGPVIKNKLFFFASLEYEDASNPGDQRQASRDGLSPDGVTVSRVPASQLDDVRTKLLELYQYEAGDYENKTFASNGFRTNLRLDYNINKNHKAFVRFNNYAASRDIQINGNSIRYLPGSLRFRNTQRTGIEAMNFNNSDYQNSTNITSIVAELNSVLGSKLSNSLNIGYTSITDPRRNVPGGADPFPFIEVLEEDGSGNLQYYMSMGNELYTVGNLLENRVFNITDNISYYTGKHTITGGFNLEFMSFENAFNPAFNGFYRYNSYDAFYSSVILQDKSVVPDAFAQGYAFDGSSNPPVDAISFSQIGFYAQDKIELSNKLKVTAGVRVELPFFPGDLPKNPEVEKFELTNPVDGKTFTPDVSKLPGVNPLISPRLAFNYNPTKKLQLRGGAGMFSGRFPFVWVSNQVNANGVTRGGYGLEAEDWGTDGNPAWDGFKNDVTAYRPDPSELEAQVTSSVNLTDENFKLPQIFRANLAADYEIGKEAFFGVEMLYSQDISTPISINTALANADEAWTPYGENGDDRPYWSSREVAFPGQFNEAFLLTNAPNNGDYYSITLSLSKDITFSNKASLSLMAAYTRSRSRDYGLEGGSQAGSLWSATVTDNRNNPEISFTRFDVPNRAVVFASYSYGGFTASVFYNGVNAGRYSYTYSGNIGDGSDRLMHIPGSREEINLVDITDADGNVVSTAAEQWDALNAFIEQDGYLKENKGSIAQRNGAALPFVHRFDIRLLQDIAESTNKRHKLQLSLDVLNFGNFLNNAWGVTKTPIQRQLLRYNGVDDNGAPTFTMNNRPGTSEFPTESFQPIFNLSQVWTAQIGLRYSF